MRSAFYFGLFVALAAAGPARAGLITGTHGLNGLGQFTGTFSYQPLTDHSAALEVQLTNTSPAATGGFVTGFVFNNPGDRITGATLTGPLFFKLLGGPSFNNSVNGAPFGQFDLGAAVGGSFEGGGKPSRGLGVLHSGQFYFALTGHNLNEISENDFLSAPSAGPGDGQGHPAFVARFRGFDNPHGPDSDKTPIDRQSPPSPPLHHFPEPPTGILGGLAVLAIGGVVGLRRIKRA
jgi:hypothetical protein